MDLHRFFHRHLRDADFAWIHLLQYQKHPICFSATEEPARKVESAAAGNDRPSKY